jgi:murein DD-endopeptidase MepM/ murein hydrolase activator NlpD
MFERPGSRPSVVAPRIQTRREPTVIGFVFEMRPRLARRFPVIFVTACLLAWEGCTTHVTRNATESLAPIDPILRTADLDIGEMQTLELNGSQSVALRLIDLRETRGEVNQAIRHAEVDLDVNGQVVTLTCGNYELPITHAGVQIDCGITRGYLGLSSKGNVWGLNKAARVRVWPAGSPLFEPGTLGYPVRQRWFASLTQMGNEPVYADGNDLPNKKEIYYHSGLDIGGCEGCTDVIAATDGLVVSSGVERLAGHTDSPIEPRYDVLYILDGRGWYYRYSHLMVIEPEIRIGARVRLGQKLGVLGKEGGSGGWSHLHFEFSSRQPSGQWGVIEGYAMLFEAYRRTYQPPLVAVARPHQLIGTGSKTFFDGRRSWGKGVLRYRWVFGDGSTAEGIRAERVYEKPGVYSEILEVRDADGNLARDFAVVHVFDGVRPGDNPPALHAAFAPTMGIRAKTPVLFKVRSFRSEEGEERWDFGDGTPRVTVKSNGRPIFHDPNGYAITQHAFDKPGRYLVSVERIDAASGLTATAHLDVLVE